MATQRRIAQLAVLTLALGLAASARAQDYDTAGKHFADGQERYATKRFHTAALEFQAAYNITKDPVLLYNVGESWQKAGDTKRSVLAYRAYLKERPTAQDRVDVERRVASMESPKKLKGKPVVTADLSAAGDKDEATTWLAQGGAPAPAAPVEPPPATEPVATPVTTPVAAPVATPEAPPAPAVVETPAAPKPADPPPPQVGLLDERPSSKLRIAAWASVASTIALLTTGAILGLAAQSRADEISRRLNFVDSSGQPREFDAGARSDFQSLKDDGRLYNGLAIGFYSAAGAMAIATTVLFVVDYKRGKAHKDTHALRLAPSFGRAEGGLVLGGSF